jgi:hypothetical protein
MSLQKQLRLVWHIIVSISCSILMHAGHQALTRSAPRSAPTQQTGHTTQSTENKRSPATVTKSPNLSKIVLASHPTEVKSATPHTSVSLSPTTHKNIVNAQHPTQTTSHSSAIEHKTTEKTSEPEVINSKHSTEVHKKTESSEQEEKEKTEGSETEKKSQEAESEATAGQTAQTGSDTGAAPAETTGADGLPEIDIALAEPQNIEILPLEAPEGVKLERLTFNIPVIGEIALDPTKDPKTGEDILKGTLADQSRKLTWGPLVIDQGEIIMRPGDKVSLDGRTTLFGKHATLTLKDLTRTKNLETDAAAQAKNSWQIGRMNLQLTFIDQPKINILPDQSIILKKCNLLVERGKPLAITANIRLFGQPVKLMFDFTKDILGISFIMTKPLKLGSLVKPLQNTRFNPVLFKNINFRTAHKVSSGTIPLEADQPSTTFSGQVDFSTLFPGNKSSTSTPVQSDDTASASADSSAGATPDSTTPDSSQTDATANTSVENTNAQATPAAQTSSATNNAGYTMGSQALAQNQQILSPDGPVDPHSAKIFAAIQARFAGAQSKLVVPGESTDDASVVADPAATPQVSDAAIDAAQADNSTNTSAAPADTGAQSATPAAPTDDAVNQLNTPVNNLEFSARYSKQEGIHFQALVSNLQLPVIGSIANATFVFDYGMQKASIPKLMLSGTGQVSVPEIGLLDYELKAGYSKNGLLLQAAIKKEIDFQGISIKQANLTVRPKKKILIIGGDTNIRGFDLIANIEVRPDPETKKSTVNFSAHVEKETFKPFEKTGISQIKDFVVHNMKAQVTLAVGDQKNAELSISGKSNILNVDNSDVDLKFIVNSKGQEGVLLQAQLPENWKFTDSIHALRGTVFDRMTFHQASFIANSLDGYIDPTTSVEIKQGLTLRATCPLTGALAPVKTMLGGKLDTVSVYGTISTDPRDIVLGAQLTQSNDQSSLAVKTNKISAGPMSLEISGRPSIAILCTIYVHPSEKDQPLDFIGRIQIDPLEADFAATMLGTWQNPFGIHGFAIGNLATQIGFNYAQLSATGLPSKLGLAGEMALGDRKMAMAAQFDSTLKDMALFGSLNELTLVDLIKLFAKPLGAKVPTDKIPLIALKDIEVKFAPQNVHIGEIVIPQGITVKGELDIMKERAVLDCNVSTQGVKALSYTSPIKYGPLSITSSHPGDSPTGGPIIDLELSPSLQQFLLSGKIDLDKIFLIDSYMKVTTSGIEFNFDTDIAQGMFNAHVVGKSSGPINNPDFDLLIDMKQKFIKYILDQVNAQLSIAQKEIKEKIDRAQREIDKINTAVATSDRDIQAAQNKIDAIRKIVDTLTSRIQEANKIIDDAKRNVDNAQKKLDALNQAREISDRELNNAVASLERAKQTAQREIQDAQNKFDNALAPARRNVNHLHDIYENTDCARIKDFKSFWRFSWVTDCGKKYGAEAAWATANLALSGIEASAQGPLNLAKITANGLISTSQAAVDKIANSVTRIALLAAQKTAEETLKIYKATLDKIVRTVAVGSIELSRQAAQASLKSAQTFLEGLKNISRGTLNAAKVSSKGFLEGIKQSGVAIVEGGKYVAKGMLGTIDITRARFEGSLHKIESGKLPDMLFELTVFDQKRVVNFTFDFTKPADSAVALARSITDLVFGPARQLPEPTPLALPDQSTDQQLANIKIPEISSVTPEQAAQTAAEPAPTPRAIVPPAITPTPSAPAAPARMPQATSSEDMSAQQIFAKYPDNLPGLAAASAEFISEIIRQNAGPRRGRLVDSLCKILQFKMDNGAFGEAYNMIYIPQPVAQANNEINNLFNKYPRTYAGYGEVARVLIQDVIRQNAGWRKPLLLHAFCSILRSRT